MSPLGTGETRFTQTGEWEVRASNLFTALHLDSIKSRIVVFALLAALIPSLSTAWLSHNQNRRSLTEKIDDELRSAAVRSAREADLWLRDHEFDVRVFAGSDPVYEFLSGLSAPMTAVARAEAAAQLTDYLDRVRLRSADLAQILVLDDLGTPIAGTTRSQTLVLPAGWDDGPDDAIALGDPYWDDQLKRRVIVLAMAVRLIDGRQLGGLVATVDLDSLSAVLHTDWSSPGLETFLVEPGGTVVASSDATFDPTGVTLSSESMQQLAASDSVGVSFTAYDGEAAIGVRSAIGRVGWMAVAQIPEATAFDRVGDLRNKTVLLVVVLLFVLGFIAYQLALLIVKPLDRLTNGVAEVSTGDFAVDLPVTVGGEVGALTRVFNDMVARLREGRDRLVTVHDQLMTQNEELERLSMTDGLTGLYNRRYLMDAMTTELARARRNGHTFAVVIMDVDHFKQFNDTHGHLAGDDVLRGVGEVLREIVRETDCAARYGGEEFLVMLPETGLDGGVGFAERVREQLSRRRYPVGDGSGESITLSLGVSSYPACGETADAVISAADDALYRAKKAGRDRVIGADHPTRAQEDTAGPPS